MPRQANLQRIAFRTIDTKLCKFNDGGVTSRRERWPLAHPLPESSVTVPLIGARRTQRHAGLRRSPCRHVRLRWWATRGRATGSGSRETATVAPCLRGSMERGVERPLEGARTNNVHVTQFNPQSLG